MKTAIGYLKLLKTITLAQQAQEEALTNSTNLQATKVELYKGGRARR